jgi:hypothetical protein
LTKRFQGLDKKDERELIIDVMAWALSEKGKRWPKEMKTDNYRITSSIWGYEVNEEAKRQEHESQRWRILWLINPFSKDW